MGFPTYHMRPTTYLLPWGNCPVACPICHRLPHMTRDCQEMPPPPHPSLAWIDAELASLEHAGLRRRIAVRTGPQSACVSIDGQELVNFGSNDYLALAADPRLAAAAAEAARLEGWGSGASPLILGNGHFHQRLTQRLAEFEQAEAAVVFPSGFAANAGSIAALVGPGDVVYTDRNNHASLLDGCRLSRADVRVYPHGDCRHLERLLTRSGYRRRLIVTDSLFSMDGDLAPLGELADLADRHGAMLMIDEAHATGVFGPGGRGVAEHLGVADRIPIRIGTLSKALGSAGGFVVGSRMLCDWLINRARPYIFSTASPPAIAAASIAALDIVEQEPQRRQLLLSRAADLRACLADCGWDIGRSQSQIIPVIVGQPERAIHLSATLRRRGLFVPAIRPPTVPDGQCCLRISLTHGHTAAMVESLVEGLGLAGEGIRD
jgi:8-amino-7-oxononanoate synthase